MSSPATVLTTL